AMGYAPKSATRMCRDSSSEYCLLLLANGFAREGRLLLRWRPVSLFGESKSGRISPAHRLPLRFCCRLNSLFTHALRQSMSARFQAALLVEASRPVYAQELPICCTAQVSGVGPCVDGSGLA